MQCDAAHQQLSGGFEPGAVVGDFGVTRRHDGLRQLAVSRLQVHLAALHRLFERVKNPVLLPAGAARPRQPAVTFGIRIGKFLAFAHRGRDRHGGRDGPPVGFVGRIGAPGRLVAGEEAVHNTPIW